MRSWHVPVLGSALLLAGCVGSNGWVLPPPYAQAGPAPGQPYSPPGPSQYAQPGPGQYAPPGPGQYAPPGPAAGQGGLAAGQQVGFGGGGGPLGALFGGVLGPHVAYGSDRYAKIWYYCHDAERQAKIMQCGHLADTTHNPSCLAALSATPQAMPEYAPAVPTFGASSRHADLCGGQIMTSPPPPDY